MSFAFSQDTFTFGLLLSAGNIIAIGGQNIHIIKNGIARNHVFWICTICFLSDVLLITSGVLGVGQLLKSSLYLTLALACVGVLFLAYYAYNNFKEAFSYATNPTFSGVNTSLKVAIGSTLAMTYLNPHVYIDTILVLGSIGGTLDLSRQVNFLLGALLASLVWFYSIGYASAAMARFFQSRRNQQIMSLVVGLIMLGFAFGMAKFAWTTWQSIGNESLNVLA